MLKFTETVGVISFIMASHATVFHIGFRVSIMWSSVVSLYFSAGEAVKFNTYYFSLLLISVTF
jgi:hypothetical protein